MCSMCILEDINACIGRLHGRCAYLASLTTTIKGKHRTFSLSKITQFQLLSVVNVFASLHLMNSDNLLTT